MVRGGSAWPTSTSLRDSRASLICSLTPADHEGRRGRAYWLAPDGGQLAAGGDHGMPTCLLDRVDGQDADDLVTGSDRPVVDEPLLAMDDPAEVDPGFRVLDQLPVALLGDQDGERGSSDHVAVTPGPGLHLVEVNDVMGAHRLGELAYLLPAHGIRGSGRVGAPGETHVDGHGDHPRTRRHASTTAPPSAGRSQDGLDREP